MERSPDNVQRERADKPVPDSRDRGGTFRTSVQQAKAAANRILEREPPAIAELHAAVERKDAAGALALVKELKDSDEFQALIDDQLFRAAAGKLRVKSGTREVGLLAVCTRYWKAGLAQRKQPTNAAPAASAEEATEDPKLEAIAQQLATALSGHVVMDDPVVGIIRQFAREGHGKAGAAYVRRRYLELTQHELRDDLVQGCGRVVVVEGEQVFHYRAAVAAVGVVGGKAAHGGTAEALQALRTQGGEPLSQLAYKTALAVRDALGTAVVGKLVSSLKRGALADLQREFGKLESELAAAVADPDNAAVIEGAGLAGANAADLAAELLSNAYESVQGPIARSIEVAFGDSDEAETVRELLHVSRRDLDKRAGKTDAEIDAAERARQVDAELQAVFSTIATLSPTRRQDLPALKGRIDAIVADDALRARYREKFGIEPHDHVVQVVRELTKRFAATELSAALGVTPAELATTAEPAHADAAEPASTDGGDGPATHVTSGFTDRTAADVAADLWRTLHDGGEVHLLVKVLDQHTAAQQKLIKRAADHRRWAGERGRAGDGGRRGERERGQAGGVAARDVARGAQALRGRSAAQGTGRRGAG
jgi:hypothetical protein